MIEYSITIKTESETLTVKETSYDPIVLSGESDFWKAEIEKALLKFGFNESQESPEIVIKAKLIYQL